MALGKAAWRLRNQPGRWSDGPNCFQHRRGAPDGLRHFLGDPLATHPGLPPVRGGPGGVPHPAASRRARIAAAARVASASDCGPPPTEVAMTAPRPRLLCRLLATL